MRVPRKISLVRSLIFILVASVTWMTGFQMRAEAMLVPVSAAPAGPQINRSEDLAVIQKTLESKIIRQKLHAMGLSDQEIQTRVSRLSDPEVHQLASQIRSLHPAGDVLIGILVLVLLVVLIIYLIKRI